MTIKAKLIPASRSVLTLPPPRPLEGALMRRHDQRDGCGARGLRRNEALGRRRGSARVHYEIPPGAGFKSPILTRSGMKRGPPPANTASKHALGMRRAELGAQAARGAVAHQIRAHVARREAPAAFRKEERTPQVCAFRRAIPLLRDGPSALLRMRESRKVRMRLASRRRSRTAL